VGRRLEPRVGSDLDAWTRLRGEVARSRARSGRWLVTALIVSSLVVSVGAVLLLAHAASFILP
jgi:hypothetical protein